MITLDAVSKNFGSRVLFENVSITFNPGSRYGLTGPNGAGKSTLLKIIMGLEHPSSGVVRLPKKLGFLRQNIEDFKDVKALDAVIMGNSLLWDVMVEREALYEQEMTDEVGMRLAELEEKVADQGGYTADSDAEMLLSGMGIPEEAFEKKMAELPQDFQFRILLCQALFGDPQALILDEPTNHLDMASIRWLENFLINYQGALIVVSHDRHFLNAVTTDIADIDYETVIDYPGNYDDMVLAKTSIRKSAEDESKSKDKKIAKLKEFVAKFGAGTRASQVQSRKKEMSKLQPQDLKQSNIQRPYIAFTPAEKQAGRTIFNVKNVHKSYDHEVIKKLSFEVYRDEKIAVIGSNGRGKTTLLKMLAEVLDPDQGSVEVGHQVKISYFPQNHADVVDKNCDDTVFEWLRSRRQGMYDQDIRGALGKLLFSGDDAHKKVKTLSGGETARLILAAMMLEEHNVLILDEPNNHLDLEAVSALSQGLKAYKGTVIVVSHDQDLVSTVADRVIAFEKDDIRVHDGNLENYLQAAV